MLDLIGQLPLAIGAILAAFITGTIALVGMLISKDQKTTEFRHAWIQDFRNEISRYISLAKGKQTTKALIDYYQRDRETQKAIDLKTANLDKDFRELQESRHRIYLLANPEKHREIIENVDIIFDRTVGIKAHENRKEGYQELIRLTQVLLKTEWERVKSGEFVFKLFKWSVIFVVSASLLLLIYFASGLNNQANISNKNSQPDAAKIAAPLL